MMRPHAEDRLGDLGRQPREPQGLAEVGVADPLRLGDLAVTEAETPASSSFGTAKRARAP